MSSVKSNSAMGQYRATDAYGVAASGDRLELVSRMMQGAIDRISAARGHVQRNEVAEKGEQIGRAIGLIDGLRSCLNMERGEEISVNLEALYDYMLNRLMEASLKNDQEALAEVAELLTEIKSGWTTMAVEYRQQHPHPEQVSTVGA